MIKFCKYCSEHPKSDAIGHNGYIPYLYDNVYECPFCTHKLVDVNISSSDYMDIIHISGERSFIDAMIKLHDNNPIEYQLKMQQFRRELSQQKQDLQETHNTNTPHCPTCSSTNIRKISGISKAGSIAMWGIFSRKVHKQWHCNNCGSEW